SAIIVRSNRTWPRGPAGSGLTATVANTKSRSLPSGREQLPPLALVERALEHLPPRRRAKAVRPRVRADRIRRRARAARDAQLRAQVPSRERGERLHPPVRLPRLEAPVLVRPRRREQRLAARVQIPDRLLPVDALARHERARPSERAAVELREVDR